MTHKVIFRVETGKSDSLTESVKLFCTLTQVEAKEQTPSYTPTRPYVWAFKRGVEKKVELDWRSGAGFCMYELAGSDKRGTKYSNPSPYVSIRESLSITTSAQGGAEWRGKGIPASTAGSIAASKQSQYTITNETGSAQNVCLCVCSADRKLSHAIGLYDTLETRKSFIVPSNLMLQAYIVDASVAVGPVLQSTHLKRPLFPVPLSCDTLPESSSWKLSQDRNGDIKLLNDGDTELGNHSIETLAKSVSDMHGLLSLVFKTLDSTHQQLASLEKSLSSTQTDLTNVRGKLTPLERAVPTIETNASELENSLVRTETLVVEVEESVTLARLGLISGEKGLAEVRAQLLAMEKVSAAPKGALSTVQESCVTTTRRVSDLDQKVPLLEERLSAVEAVVGKSDKELSVVDSSFNAQRNPLSNLADRQIPRLENSYALDKLSMLQKSVDLSREHLSTLDRRVLAVETKTDGVASRTAGRLSGVDSSPAGDSVAAFGEQVASLDRRVPLVEATLDELKRSFGETKKDVSVMRKLLRTRFPALESRADELEKSVGQVQEELTGLRSSLDSSGERLTSLGMRVALVEGSLRGIGVGPHDIEPAAHARSQSPLLFPSQSHASRTSTPSPSREAAFFSREDSDSDLGE